MLVSVGDVDQAPASSSGGSPASKKKVKNGKVKRASAKDSTKEKSGKASFKRHGGTAAKSKLAVTEKFKGFDLTKLPADARPDMNRKNVGRLSYTLEFNTAVIEVGLAKRFFLLKRIASGFPGPKGRQLTWGKFDSITEAWNEAKRLSGFVRDM